MELVKQDCALLQDRGELFACARKRVDDEGYSYKKKVSRSTAFGKQATQSKQTKKRQYLHNERRKDKIQELSGAIQNHNETIGLLEKQKQKYSNTEKFLEAAEINKSILEIHQERQLKMKELAKLEKAETKSRNSKKRKTSSTERKSSKSGALTERLSSDDISSGRKSSNSEALIEWPSSNDTGTSNVIDLDKDDENHEFEQKDVENVLEGDSMSEVHEDVEVSSNQNEHFL